MPALPLAAPCSSLQGVPAWCPDVGTWHLWGLHPQTVRTLHQEAGRQEGAGGAASEGGQRTALILGKGANASWPSWGPSAGRGVRRPGLGVPPALGHPRGKRGADAALPPIRPGTGIWGGFPVSLPLRPSLPGAGGPPASGAGPVRHSGDFHQHRDSSLCAVQGGMGRPCPWPTQSCSLSWGGSGLSRAPALLWALPGPGGWGQCVDRPRSPGTSANPKVAPVG